MGRRDVSNVSRNWKHIKKYIAPRRTMLNEMPHPNNFVGPVLFITGRLYLKGQTAEVQFLMSPQV